MVLSGSLPQINLGVQGETQGGLHNSGQTLTPVELYIGIKPSIRHLGPFGSILYQSNSGVVLESPGLKFSDYEVVENCDDDDKTVNNIPVSLPQDSDSETEDEELSRTDSSVVPAKTSWKRVVVPRPDGSRNDRYYYELGKSQRLDCRCIDIVGFSDADFAANRDDRISMGGQSICLGNAPVT
ncbi:hypothetical protein TNCV_4146011 [Trichonephila clavipes]|nr:hypothetical protein TNCV_4146011 [Trichonephila clavipes]